MKKLTTSQGFSLLGTIVTLVLGIIFLMLFKASKECVSASSDFTATLMSIALVFWMLCIVFIVLTIRAIIYKY